MVDRPDIPSPPTSGPPEVAPTRVQTVPLLRATLEATSDGILIVDRCGGVIDCNRRFLDLWRVPPEVGEARDDNRMRRLVLDQLKDPAAFERRIDEIYADPPAEQYDLIEFTDGRAFERCARPLRVGGQTVGIVFCFRDVAERRRFEQALTEGEERFRLLVDSVRDYAILMLDVDGNVVSWNAGAERILGYTADEIIGTSFSRFFAEGDVLMGNPAAELELAAADGHVEDEGWRIRKGGTRFWANAVTTALWDNAGKLRGFSKVTRDITERKRVEWLERDRRQVLEMVAQNQPLDVVLRCLAELIERQCMGMRACLLLLRDGALGHAAAPQLPESFLKELDGCSLRLAAGLRGVACEGNHTTVVSDIATDPLWAELREPTLALDLRVCWSSPVCASSGDALGVLLLFGSSPRGPSRADRDMLEMVCKLSAIAVEQKQLTEQLAHQAHHDLLTGLPNRMRFEDRLQLAIYQAQRSGQSVGLFLIDLDRFKYVNDTLGHHAGDSLLHQVANRWKGCMREYDTLARLGGDEFGLVLPMLEDREDAVRVAQRLVESLKIPIEVAGHELTVTASIGVSIYPQDGTDTVTLQRNADTAMYRTKTLGRNGFQCFEPEMNAAAIEKLELEGHLRRATDRNEFQLHYQLQVDRWSRAVGSEVLLRWKHPKLGSIPPIKFIPLAEETGLIIPIGRWVLREACRENKAWQDAGIPPMKVAVNVSALQFAQADFVEVVASALRDSRLDPQWLEIEITESLLMQNYQEAIAKLATVRKLGVGVAVDDFGTGYSSLAYLQRLPIDTLKIDRSFVKEIGPDALLNPSGSDTAVIRAIASLAHSLGLGVVAEGVETEHQRQFLLRLGVEGMQGYLFSKPIPAAELLVLLRTTATPAPLAAAG